MPRVITFSDSFTSASAPVVEGAIQENYVINNNQALTNITGLVFNNAEAKSVFFDFELERIGTTTYRQAGSFIAVYNGTWSLTFGNFQGSEIIESPLANDYGFDLSIDASTGQLKYSSGNQAGHTSSKLKLYIVKVIV
jgi:hypothetical protein